jgi:hypothetical protein
MSMNDQPQGLLGRLPCGCVVSKSVGSLPASFTEGSIVIDDQQVE